MKPGKSKQDQFSWLPGFLRGPSLSTFDDHPPGSPALSPARERRILRRREAHVGIFRALPRSRLLFGLGRRLSARGAKLFIEDLAERFFGLTPDEPPVKGAAFLELFDRLRLAHHAG